MNCRFGGAMLVAAGIIFGCALSSYDGTQAASPTAPVAAADERETDMAAQLKDIRVQLKEINTLLHSGTIKVVVVLNPEK